MRALALGTGGHPASVERSRRGDSSKTTQIEGIPQPRPRTRTAAIPRLVAWQRLWKGCMMSPTFDLQTLLIVGLIGIILGMLVMMTNRVPIRIEMPERSGHESPFGALGGCLGSLVMAVAIGFAIYLILQTLR